MGVHGAQTGGRGRVRSFAHQRCPALGCGSCTACLLFQPKGIMEEAGGGGGGPGAGGTSPGHVLRARRESASGPSLLLRLLLGSTPAAQGPADWFLLRIGAQGLVSAQWPLSTKCRKWMMSFFIGS